MSDGYLPLIERMLETSVADESIPQALRASMAYSLLSGGKRLRPRICLACCELLGGRAKDALPLACGIEMIHAYSLVHDDLPCMDDDDFRRGKPASHKVYGEAGAVLAGDALLTHAFEWMLSHAPEDAAGARTYLSAVLAVARGAGAAGMVAGQSLELSGALNEARVSLEEVQRLKTGALIKAAALSGGIAAGGGGNQLRLIEAFAEQYGALFQLTDDLIDAEQESGDVKNAASAYGLAEARRLAAYHAREAHGALTPFGERAAYLIALVEGTLGRAD